MARELVIKERERKYIIYIFKESVEGEVIAKCLVP